MPKNIPNKQKRLYRENIGGGVCYIDLEFNLLWRYIK